MRSCKGGIQSWISETKAIQIKRSQMEQCETILEVGAEGGSLTIYGIRTTSGSLFSEEVIDHTPEMIDEPGIRYKLNSLETWDAALNRLDRYRWFRLCPLQVHPEFKDTVFDAVISRFKADDQVDPPLHNWSRLCKNGMSN
jgi:hypothetical protein